MLTQRLLVAAIGLPLLGVLLALPEPLFAAIVVVILGLAAFEMIRALVPDLPRSLPLGAAAATMLFAAFARVSSALPLWSFLLVTGVALALILRPHSRLAQSLGGWWVTAVLYVGVLGAHIVLLRDLHEGQRWLLVLLAATFAADTGAYAIGRLFGRHKLIPSVSPNKTWEGAVGGLVFGAIAAVAATLLAGLHMGDFGVEAGAATAAVGPAGLVALAFVLPVAAIAGDLVESALKRRMNVKDMSGLLPGHGGLLDRLDSILVVGACLYWIVRWLQT